MLNTQLTTLAINKQAEVLGELLDNGFVDVMDGAQPRNADEPITTQRVLVTMTFAKPAFREAKDGVIAANRLMPGVAIETGDPTWYRAYQSDHKTVVFDGTAGMKNANMILPAKTIVQGVTVGASGLTHTVVKSMAGI